jgi:heat-inducible transcriptional repressor
MNELTERQKFILALVIHDYIRSASPVGSRTLVDAYHLDLSSATVRNELSSLTEMGYLRQPHTSAGRIPTEEGYRYFVSRLVQEAELPDATRRMINHQFYQSRNDVDQWTRLAASILANQSRVASLVTAPHTDTGRFKHLELISTRGRQLLMVLVMMSGELNQRFVTLSEPVSQEELSSVAHRISTLFNGLNVAAISQMRPQLTNLEQDVADWVIEEMRSANALVSGEIYLDGLTNMMTEPEFTESDEARRALKILEERSLLQELLARTSPNAGVGSVQVLIGGEGPLEELRMFSVILSRYGVPGSATGILGALGPMRMPYGRTISTIRFLSRLLSDLVVETLAE